MPETKDCRLLIKNASQIVTVRSRGGSEAAPMKVGKEDMNELHIVVNGSLVVDNDGKIVAIGDAKELEERFAGNSFAAVVDCEFKRSVIPGLIDAHTHPVWTGDRTHEFAMKLAGATYMDIHKMGGGIGFTVRHTRDAPLEELERLLEKRLNTMKRNGTTTVECKSGYGLDLDTEIKMLRAIHNVVAKRRTDLDLVATYLGAHSVPKDKTLDAYTEEILTKHIPEIKRLIDAGEISPEFIDVFHEKGVFETEQTRRILQAGQSVGLKAGFHGDELHPMHSAELAAEIGAVSISHLEMVSEEGIVAMAQKQVVATLLPTTAYVLRIEYPPARRLIDGNVPVALASDYNPNAHCMSLPFVMNLACVQMRMTMPEALCACTLNAAAALGRSATHGSIEEGKMADLVIVDSKDWQHIIYELCDPPIAAVIKAGKVIHESSSL